jgi:hypothetical protein
VILTIISCSSDFLLTLVKIKSILGLISWIKESVQYYLEENQKQKVMKDPIKVVYPKWKVMLWEKNSIEPAMLRYNNLSHFCSRCTLNYFGEIVLLFQGSHSYGCLYFPMGLFCFHFGEDESGSWFRFNDSNR